MYSFFSKILFQQIKDFNPTSNVIKLSVAEFCYKLIILLYIGHHTRVNSLKTQKNGLDIMGVHLSVATVYGKLSHT